MKDDETRVYAPQEVQSMLLGNIKRMAEKRLNQVVTSCVVTVPANFNDRQKNATMEACGIAGLKVLRIITEPVAASIAYL
mmetsp:Transcript_42025/g.55379  ORF Transcript_42025/g.55379 Transcript_42025/m.55379 type:complete len:80 (-) Transcript_42025:1313-1552(-)